MEQNYIDYRLQTLDASAGERERVRVALAACNECHSYARDDHTNAPSLAGVFGREAGSTTYDGYTDALAESDIVWDTETLTAYLADPQARVPGTAMQAFELSDTTRGHLVGILEGLSSDVEIPANYAN
jgi:cytochrome c